MWRVAESTHRSPIKDMGFGLVLDASDAFDAWDAASDAFNAWNTAFDAYHMYHIVAMRLPRVLI